MKNRTYGIFACLCMLLMRACVRARACVCVCVCVCRHGEGALTGKRLQLLAADLDIEKAEPAVERADCCTALGVTILHSRDSSPRAHDYFSRRRVVQGVSDTVSDT